MHNGERRWGRVMGAMVVITIRSSERERERAQGNERL